MLRGVIFLALVGGAGFSAWTSFQDSSRNPLDWAVGEVHAMVTQHENGLSEESTPRITEAQPIVLATDTATPDDRFTISKETLAAITCGPWDVSDVGIEAILQEMIRRGWTPPSGSQALQASDPVDGIKAVDPDAPVPTLAQPVVAIETQASAEPVHAEASAL